MATLPEIVGEFVTDAATSVGVPGAALAGGAVTRYLNRRMNAARDILMEELRDGRITDQQVASEDDAVAVCYRYARAAVEGAARLNLRLLAKVIAGKFAMQTLVADEFLMYAEALATLSRDEIIVVGLMYRAWSEQTQQAQDRPDTLVFAWGETQRGLSAQGWDQARMNAAATRAQRFGLIFAMSGWGALTFTPSPSLIDLGRTIDFDDALRRESKA